MNEGRCPSCKSDEIYTTQAFANLRSHGDSVNVSADLQGNDLSISAYVCLQCGHVALFADDLSKLPALATSKGWYKVSR